MTEPDAESPDVLELLEADHRRIERVLAESTDTAEIVREIATHLVAEDQELYREARKQLDADALVDACLDLDHRLEETLVRLEDGKADVNTVAELMARHVDRQESDLFPALHETVDHDRLVALGDALQMSVRGAPRHAHPHLPDEGSLEVIADAVAARLDQLRDAYRRGRRSD
jgi:hypothetical protein